MAVCQHAKPAGIVTNQNPVELPDGSRAHASIVTCDRPVCIAGCQKWVAGETNETATFYPFVEIRAALAAQRAISGGAA